MAEILFYHLTHSSLEQNLPDLLEKTLARGWRALVRCGSAAGLAALDDRLWTFRDDAFLPHGTSAGAHPALQPVYMTLGAENPNAADVLMLVDGARAPVEEMARFTRACLIFDGADADMVEAARRDWRAVRDAGLTAVYWAQEDGRWTRKAST
jgi:DNA polymerase-3 subunit chi